MWKAACHSMTDHDGQCTRLAINTTGRQLLNLRKDTTCSETMTSQYQHHLPEFQNDGTQ